MLSTVWLRLSRANSICCGRWMPSSIEEPVVERPMDLELEGADRMGDALDRIRLAVGPVIGRIDAPGVAPPVMMGPADAVHDRVAHEEVGMGHVDLGPERLRAVGEFAGPHPAEEVEVLLDGPVPARAFLSRLGQRPAVFGDLLRAQVADIGLALS